MARENTMRLPEGVKIPITVALCAVAAFAAGTIWSLNYWSTGAALTAIFALAIWTLFLARAPRWTWSLSLLFAIAGWQVVQLALHVPIYRFAAEQSLLMWCGYACAFWVGVQVFDNPQAVRCFRGIVLGVAFVCSLIAILKAASGSDRILWFLETPYSRDAIGLFLNRNYYAAFIELTLPLALTDALIRQRKVLLNGAIAATMFASVILSASRAGTALVILELLVFLAAPLVRAIRGAGAREYWTAIASLVLVLLTTSVVGWDALTQRLRSNEHLGNRLAFASASVRMIQDHPLLGTGLGSWPIAYPAYATIDAMAEVNHAHNDWLEWAAEGGIPFAGLMLLLCLRAFRHCFRYPWGVGLLSVCLHSTLDFPLQKFPILLIFLLVAAALEARAGSERGYISGRSLEQLTADRLVYDIRAQ